MEALVYDLVLAAACLLGAVLGLVYKPEAPTAETPAFQLLMTGTAEELTYRGIAPALLPGLVRSRNPPQATPWVVICIAAVPFSLVHGFLANVAFHLTPLIGA